MKKREVQSTKKIADLRDKQLKDTTKNTEKYEYQ